MILQALYKLAEVEELMLDPDYEPKPVAWIVRVGENGEFLGITGTHYEIPAEGKKKPKTGVKRFNLPREKAVTSGDRAFLLFGKAEYVFGVDPANERPPEKLADRFRLFRNRVEECLEATEGDEGVRAVQRFLENEEALAQATGRREEWAPNDLFTFIYAPDGDRLVLERGKVRKYWKELRNPPQPDEQCRRHTCLVTGRSFAGATENVPKIKIIERWIPPVSFNKAAFESHSWNGNENAPISREAAEAVSTALNRLLDPGYQNPRDPNRTLPRRNLRLSADTVVCYWSPAEDTIPMFGLMEADPEQVPPLYRSLWEGVKREVGDPTAFYALTITEERGRPIVRDWFESTIGEVQENLARHFEDITIVRNCPPPKGKTHPPSFPLGLLVEAIADPAENRQKSIPAPLSAQLLRAAFAGTVHPLAVMQRALLRFRAEIVMEEDKKEGWRFKQWNDARMALMKAYLTRKERKKGREPMLKPHLNEDHPHPAYHCGRLLAVLARLQWRALGDVGAGVVQRYYAAASSTPGLVIGRLIRTSQFHLDKLEPGLAHWYSGKIADILGHIQDSIPPTLTLEEQGLFALGYYQQIADLRTKKADNSTETEENHE